MIGMPERRRLGAVFLLTFVGFLLLAPPCPAQTEPRRAPLNPAFLAYQERIQSLEALPGQAPPGFGLGEVPDPIPPEVHRPEPAPPEERPGGDGASPLDPRFDLRDPNLDGDFSDTLLTPVRSQGACNTCWAFATFGVLEGRLKQTLGLADALNDYSENNLLHRHGFEWAPDDGGNIKMSAAYLTRFAGPIREADDPYVCGSATACTACDPVRYVDSAVFLPVRSGVGDNAYIKEALLAHGPLYTSIYWDASGYRSASHTYFYDDPNNSFDDSNHGVVIVGWDDTRAVTGAPGAGAFVVRNHWGEGWGEGGYFYVSYFDESIAFSTLGRFADDDEALFTFDTLHQYDPLGWTSSVGYGDGADWGANIFVPQDACRIVAVGFYAAASNLSYEIRIYNDFDGSSFSTPLLQAPQSGSVQHSGYYRVALDTPVTVAAQDDFAVVVKFEIPGEDFPIPMELPVPGYAATTAAAGQSFISDQGTTFSDLTGFYAETNVCIKAFTTRIRPRGLPWLMLLLKDKE